MNDTPLHHPVESGSIYDDQATPSLSLPDIEEGSFLDSDEDEALDLPHGVGYKILSEKKDITLDQFEDWYSKGDIILRPDYQRQFVASKDIASRLVESVLIDVPIPIVYLAEEHDGSYSVIDGQQRLTSFIHYLRNYWPAEAKGGNAKNPNFGLKGLTVLTDLKGKTFPELTKEQQRKIRNSSIPTVIIKRESDEDVKFAIFERLNTGTTKLNIDELRNTTYRGPMINLLARLSNNEDYHALVRREEQRKRFIYRGHILRFFAFTEQFMEYNGNAVQFGNKYLRNHQQIVPEHALDLENKFLHAVYAVKNVFGPKAFRRYLPSTNGFTPGRWDEGQMNLALHDLQMVTLARFSKNQIMSRKDDIYEAMVDLMSHNEEFIRLIGFSTSDRKTLHRRFQIWEEKLTQVMAGTDAQARIFNRSLKEKLFRQNPVCSLSGQTIQCIDDAEVDHIKPFSLGGTTTEDNAQLVLRYFNRQKGNRA